MEGLFDKIKKDVKKGWEEGLTAVMQGANVVSVKMNELSEEGKRQYKMFNLHVKIKDQMNELGEIACAVLKSGKNLDEDKKVKAAFTKIKKLEWQLSKLEGDKKIKTAAPKKAAKKTAKK
jgi:lipopolysaccharide export LptBFGC system permease protein LptF